MHSFKQEDLLLYIYGETSNEQTKAISLALEADWDLREKYNELVAAQQGLEPVSLSPRKKAVDFILGISYEPKPTNTVQPQPIVGEEQEAEFVSQEVGNDLPF